MFTTEYDNYLAKQANLSVPQLLAAVAVPSLISAGIGAVDALPGHRLAGASIMGARGLAIPVGIGQAVLTRRGMESLLDKQGIPGQLGIGALSGLSGAGVSNLYLRGLDSIIGKRLQKETFGE